MNIEYPVHMSAWCVFSLNSSNYLKLVLNFLTWELTDSGTCRVY